MNTLEELKQIKKELENTNLPKAKIEWGGAEIIITQRAPSENSDDPYHNPVYVITKYSFELSWLFEKLRDTFNADEIYNSYSKYEFFGRLAKAANLFLQQSKSLSEHSLCAAVLHEAFIIYHELDY
jgi:hypothetical protein